MKVVRQGGWLGVAALLVAQASPLLAQDLQRKYGLSTQVDACVPIDRARFESLLAIELGEAVSSGVDDHSLATVALDCEGDQIEVRLEDRVTRKAMTRRVDIQNVAASARTRLMALTVAEFVLASWLEVRLFHEERLQPLGPAPPPEVERRAAAAVDSRLGEGVAQLGAAIETIAFSNTFRFIPCIGVRFGYVTPAKLAFRVGLQLGHGTLEGKLERQPVQIRTTLASLIAAVLYAAQLDRFEIDAGIGARFGFASLAGAQSGNALLESEQSYAPWGGPLATASVGYRLGANARIAIALEAGYAAASARAVGPRPERPVVAELDEVWTSASLAFDWVF